MLAGLSETENGGEEIITLGMSEASLEVRKEKRFTGTVSVHSASQKSSYACSGAMAGTIRDGKFLKYSKGTVIFFNCF